MVTQDYVSIETAKILRENGFNEPCEKSYYTEGFDNPMIFSHDLLPITQNGEYLCPTLQMVMKWLREKYNIIIVIDTFTEMSIRNYCCIIRNMINGKMEYSCHNYKTYEEATEEAIKYCLTKII